MKITNKYNAPLAIEQAISKDDHVVKGDISTTTLIDTPQIRYLKKKYPHEIEYDVRDLFPAFFGTIAHKILEESNVFSKDFMFLIKAAGILSRNSNGNQSVLKAAEWLKQYAKDNFPNNENLFLERTLSFEFGGYEISGTQDVFNAETGLLQDWKTCTVSSTTYYDQEKLSWEQQQNIYAYALRKLGYTVNKIEIVAIYRDWSKMKIPKGGTTYPKAPWDIFEMPIWTDLEVEAFLEKRIAVHKQADLDNPPPCTPKERWSTDDTFAVMATGGVKAKKLFKTYKEAQDFIDEYGMKMNRPYIESRIGVDLRCYHYCPVSHICEQFKERKRQAGLE